MSRGPGSLQRKIIAAVEKGPITVDQLADDLLGVRERWALGGWPTEYGREYGRRYIREYGQRWRIINKSQHAARHNYRRAVLSLIRSGQITEHGIWISEDLYWGRVLSTSVDAKDAVKLRAAAAATPKADLAAYMEVVEALYPA
jgi:hypothetical protein